jgi:hypothetical protein
MPNSYTTNLVNIFTLMMNTPLVDPESMTRPTAIPLKTFSSSYGPTRDYSHQSMVRISEKFLFWKDIRTLASLQLGAVDPAYVLTAVVPFPSQRNCH